MLPIEKLGLPKRVVKTLKAAEIDTLHELIQLTSKDIQQFTRIGRKSEVAIEIALLKQNLSFGLNPKNLENKAFDKFNDWI